MLVRRNVQVRHRKVTYLPARVPGRRRRAVFYSNSPSQSMGAARQPRLTGPSTCLVNSYGATMLVLVARHDWWLGSLTLAGTLALAGAVVAGFGLALSVVNWWRLRPDVFLIARVVELPLLDDVWVPMLLRVHVSNGGGRCDLGALEVVPKAGPNLTGQARAPQVTSGAEVPCRLEGSDIKAWEIDLEMVRAMFGETRPSNSASTGTVVATSCVGPAEGRTLHSVCIPGSSTLTPIRYPQMDIRESAASTACR